MAPVELQGRHVLSDAKTREKLAFRNRSLSECVPEPICFKTKVVELRIVQSSRSVVARVGEWRANRPNIS
jgi:hypothetical protein